MILSAQSIAFAYGGNSVLTDVSFQMEDRDRIALVGHNGCGKSTLLKLLTGELLPDSGDFSLAQNAVVGFLKQDSGLDPTRTIREEMRSANNADQLLSRMKELEQTMTDDPEQLEEYRRISERYEAIDGYHLDYQIRKLLMGMGFPEDTWHKRVEVLSGGEKTRLSLAKLLLQSPDVLLLDEPTNHLDLETLDWLEDYLQGYRGAVLMVSHDQHFLDRVCTKVLSLYAGKTKLYNCNFSTFLVRREEEEAVERKHYQQTMEKAAKLEDFAKRNMARASTRNMAKSRLKMLERLDTTAPEEIRHVHIQFGIELESEPYLDVLQAKDCTIGVEGVPLCSDLDFTLERGDRLAVIGKNGCGKTTFLRTVLGEVKPLKGKLIIGGGVKIGVQRQNVFSIENESPLMYIWDRYPTMDQLEIRKLLALVGFRDEEVFTDAKGLSGGELARLNLARLSLEHPNFLLLDEPSNHLDIFSKQVLREALENYKGTLLLVSHDRWLMEALNCRVLAMENGKGTFYDNYEAYRTQKLSQRLEEAPKETRPSEEPVGVDPKQLRRERAAYRQQKAAMEKQIEELEGTVQSLQEQIQLPEIAVDAPRLQELCEELEQAQQLLSELTERYLTDYLDEK